jgi:hypothetical protein
MPRNDARRRLAAVARQLQPDAAAADHQHRKPDQETSSESQRFRAPMRGLNQGGDTHRQARDDLAGDAPPTPLEQYLFDLNGYVILRGAVSPAEVAQLNGALDALPVPRMGEWIGRAHVTATGGSGTAHGCQIQQCYEMGAPFEALIDHPAYFGKVHSVINPIATLEKRELKNTMQKYRKRPGIL